MVDLEKGKVGAVNQKGHISNYTNNCSNNHYGYEASCCVVDCFDINSICPMQDNVLATGGDDGVIKLWDKRFIDDMSNPIGGFIGHQEGIMSLDSTYLHSPSN
jgi:WD40 repeat protein